MSPLGAPLAARGDIYRWDTGELLPGTEDTTPGPGAVFIVPGLAYADLSERNLNSAQFGIPCRGCPVPQVDLTSANLHNANLSDTLFFAVALDRANLSGADLTSARVVLTTLGDADFKDAIVTGTNFAGTTVRGFTEAQLYSTASYKAADLQGVDLGYNDLTGWNFAGQNLAGARFEFATLTVADLRGANASGALFSEANLTDAQLAGANFTGADLRRAMGFVPHESTLTRNAILPDYTIAGLELGTGDLLTIRWDWPPKPVRVHDSFTVTAGGVLEFLMASDSVDTMVINADVVPQLGGTLRISEPNSSTGDPGQTLDLFDWNQALGSGNRFDRVELPLVHFAWDLSQLYTSGEITLHEPGLPDYNANGLVDQGDLSLVLLNWGQGVTDPAGVGWYNELPVGRVDQQELNKVLLAWGGTPSQSLAVAGVPEPATISILGACIICWVCFRGRRAPHWGRG